MDSWTCADVISVFGFFFVTNMRNQGDKMELCIMNVRRIISIPFLQSWQVLHDFTLSHDLTKHIKILTIIDDY